MKQVVFEETCPVCHRKNRITAIKSEDDFDDREEFFCAYCGTEIGSVSATETPKTEIIAE